MLDNLTQHLHVIENRLKTLFNEREIHHALLLNESMRYSIFPGGKRLRPILLLEFGRLIGNTYDDAYLDFACAVELIHSYSLVHDDLPCMDDDDMRRGQPSTHVKYGEAGAVLAGDALLTSAFELMLRNSDRCPARLAAAYELATASGREGMIAGQAMDLISEPIHFSNLKALEKISMLKTAALIRASCLCGLILGGEQRAERIQAASEFGINFGLAFQIRDDLLDAIGNETALGKPIGSDGKASKFTFFNLLGFETCVERVEKHTQIAIDALNVFNNADELIKMVLKMRERVS